VLNRRPRVNVTQRRLKDLPGLVVKTRSFHLTSMYGCNS
jgi:hypothetical protein